MKIGMSLAKFIITIVAEEPERYARLKLKKNCK
jgi:hypothetical protein